MIDWSNDVIDSIARRRAVLVLGAGVSRNSTNAAGVRPPLWAEFLERGIERAQGSKREMRRLLREKDLLSCCQILKYRMDHDWLPFLEQEFLLPNFQSHKIHEHIFNLDAPIVLTPNVDRIYDNYAVSQAQNKVKIKKFYDDDLARSLRGTGNYRLVLKIHGCIDAPGKMIFTREEYATARSKHDDFYRAIEALLLTHTVIFLGCGMGDPDISLLLEQYARSFSDSPPHYFITTSGISSEYESMLVRNYNLRVVPYSSKDGHLELTDSLEKLVELVENKRGELARTLLW